MCHFPFKPDQQGLKFVHPGKGSLTHEAMFVHNRVEMPFPSSFHCLSVTLVFRNVRFDAPVPQHFPHTTRIETAIHVEEGSPVVQSTTFHICQHDLELLLKLIAVMMVACNYPRRRHNVPVRVCHRQDIAGLRLLPLLIANFFAPFFAALWLPSRLSSDKFNSPRIVITLASNSRWKLPSLLHLRK